MNLEPQKFFIGLIDFFSIIMPGAMLAYLGKDWAAAQFGMTQGFPLVGAEASTVFLFASYLLGHFTFLLGAKLDDWVYDPLRAWTDWGQIKRLAKGDDLSAPWQRKLASSKWLFGKNADAAVMQAQWIKARALQGLEAEEAINAFQWSKARLTKELAGGLLAVQRFEADSKFFRSFVVVLGLLTLFYAFQCKWLATVVCFAGILPALWRFIDQRFKATQQAYWFLITLEATKTEPPPRPPRQDGLTLAGGVVYKGKGSDAKFLLIEARTDRSERVLAKGHIEPGENPRVTAVREVREETGLWARVDRWLEDSPLNDKPNSPMVRWFMLELAEKEEETEKSEETEKADKTKKAEETEKADKTNKADKWPEENRQYFWLPLVEAEKKATFTETKALLKKAAGYLTKPGKTGHVDGSTGSPRT